MHRALLVPDVVAAILALSGDGTTLSEYRIHISGGYGTNEEYRSRRSVAVAMAQTCRAFRDSALDVLWEHLSNFSNLLGLLPEDLVEQHHWTKPGRGRRLYRYATVSFRRLPTETDLVAFRDRAKRVRVFTVHCDRQGGVVREHDEPIHTVDVSVIRALAAAHEPNNPLFPALRQLLISDANVRFLANIVRWLSPQLRSLAVTFRRNRMSNPETRHQLETAWRMLPSLSPRLQQLSLSGNIWSGPRVRTKWWSSLVSQTASQLAHLEELRCSAAITPNDLCTILNLPYFRWLEAQVWPDIEYTTTPCSPRLSALVLHAETAKNLAAAIPAFRGNCITSLKLMHGDGGRKAEDIHTLSSAVACNPSFLLLTSVEILVNDPTFMQSIRGERFVIGWAYFKPLLHLRNLRHLALIPCNVPIKDQELAELALAWPDLRHLTLNLQRDLEALQREKVLATPLGLLPLAQHCPHLETLNMFVDASGEAPRVHDLPSEAITSNRALTTLHIGASFLQLEELAHLAAYLVAAFPALKEITSARDERPNTFRLGYREQNKRCDKLKSLVQRLQETDIGHGSSIVRNIATNLRVLVSI